MDLVFITNDNKLGNLDVDLSVVYKNMAKINGTAYFCYHKNSGMHNLYVLFDGDSNPLNNDDKSTIIPLLEQIINKDDFYIVQHSHQSQEITTLTDMIVENRSSKVFHGMHVKNNTELSKHYQNLPIYLTDEKALNNWVAEIKGENKKNADLNQKLTILHKLLAGDELDNEEEKIAKKAMPDYKEKIKTDKIRGIKSLRDSILNY